MRMLVPFLVEDAGLVEVVDADLARGMEDALAVEHHAHMDDLAFLVAEESQVAGLYLGKEIHQLAFFDLVGGVAGQQLACRTGAELHEAAAVDAEDAAATPQIRDVQHFLAELRHQGRRELRWVLHGEIVGLIQQGAEREVPAPVTEKRDAEDMPSFSFQLQILLVADRMVLDALDPSLVVVDLCADEFPVVVFVQYFVQLVIEQLAHHLAGVRRFFPDGDDRKVAYSE